MRVAIIAPPWVPVPPAGYGGAEAVIDNLARGLQSAGHDVLLYATGDSTCPVPTRWVRDRAAGTVETGAAIELHHVVNAYDAVVDWGAEVVHDHTLVGPIYAERFDLPVVTTNHGPFDAALTALYRAIADRVPVIALSRHHATTAADIEIAAVIHHGVDIETFPFGAGNGGYAVFLGRMSPQKGVHIAIDVARQAGVPLRIAAKMREPAEVEYFEQAVAPRLGSGSEYVGEVGGRDKIDLLANAACLINPIAWPEPFGMVMIEALATGTPVVATPCGSVPEIVTDNRSGFIRSTPAELATAVSAVCTLDRAAVRRWAAERFSTELMVKRHVRLYQHALTTHRSRVSYFSSARPAGSSRPSVAPEVPAVSSAAAR
jgi:glycosyltransferase involved in cell wall biosynthesis